MLKAAKIFIISVEDLVVEVDAKYIKGMINNPDIQPNNMINWWIAGILLFDFRLRHVPAKKHGPADALSRRRMSADDEPDDPDNDPDVWIDQANAFCVEAANWTFCPQFKAACYATSDADVPAISLPRSDKQLACDDIIRNIDAYLRSLKWPDNVADNQLRQWLVKAKHFFIQGGRLWYHDSHRRHKLVIMDEHNREFK